MVTEDSVGIARTLHDGIAQDLVALGYSIDLLIAIPETPTVIRIELRTMRFRVDELITKVRKEIFNLRSPGQGDLSIELTNIAREICGERLGKVSVSHLELPFDIHQVIVAAATELMRNSFYHSRGSQIDLTLSSIEDHIYLVVADNGIGGAQMSSTRFGLRGISERIALLHGEFELVSDENGTNARISI